MKKDHHLFFTDHHLFKKDDDVLKKRRDAYINFHIQTKFTNLVLQIKTFES